MSNVELSLTAARIRRVNPTIDKETAQTLAAELHDIIACLQETCAAHPTAVWYGGLDDTIETLLRAAVGVQPEDYGEACRESEWLMHQLTAVEKITGVRDLYRRFLRVVGRVTNFDFESLLDEDEDDATVEAAYDDLDATVEAAYDDLDAAYDAVMRGLNEIR